MRVVLMIVLLLSGAHIISSSPSRDRERSPTVARGGAWWCGCVVRPTISPVCDFPHLRDGGAGDSEEPNFDHLAIALPGPHRPDPMVRTPLPSTTVVVATASPSLEASPGHCQGVTHETDKASHFGCNPLAGGSGTVPVRDREKRRRRECGVSHYCRRATGSCDGGPASASSSSQGPLRLRGREFRCAGGPGGTGAKHVRPAQARATRSGSGGTSLASTDTDAIHGFRGRGG